MNAYLFLNTKEGILTDLQTNQKIQKIAGKNPNFKYWLYIFMFLILVGATYYVATNYNNDKIQEYQINQQLENLIHKAATNQQLTELEWNELCELLLTVKGINVNDCENCRDYIRAILGGKHEVFLKNYEKRTDRELQKGIRSIQKQIIEHQDKIVNPQKHYPEWENVRPEKREHLVNEKWNEDIQRQREQKEILECILKNRK